MKKIKLNELTKIAKIIAKLDIQSRAKGRSKIFFPIDTEKLMEIDEFQLTYKDSNKGGAALVKPGLIIGEKSNPNSNSILLAYATLEYAPKFNFIELLDILGVKISKKELDVISDLECLLVKNDYILEIFDL